ncbi:MAG: hypothetical protein J6X33_08620 [Clostridiales bacterium]|nr:hypothetical protein [Clostridiales bacterium]
MSDFDNNKLGKDALPGIKADDVKDLEGLYEAILTLKDPNELHMFFRDLCSVNEIYSFLHRWQIVKLLDEGKNYDEILKELTPDSDDLGGTGVKRNKTTVSSTTIARVKKCYVNPYGGYRTALSRLAEEGRDPAGDKN